MDDLAEQILARFEARADPIAEEISTCSVAEIDGFREVDDALLHDEIRALARRHLDAFEDRSGRGRHPRTRRWRQRVRGRYSVRERWSRSRRWCIPT